MKNKSAKTFSTAVIIASSLMLVSCFKNSPFNTELSNETRNLNLTSKKQIESLELGNNFKFAFIADNHQNYTDFKKTIERLNQRSDIDFIVHGGDLTNNSANWEFDIVLDILGLSKKPVVTVIGNHDAIGNGKILYRKAFGTFNYTLHFANTHFIFWNNNTLEFENEGIDIDWLDNQLDFLPTDDQVILVQHVNTLSETYFSEEEKDYLTSTYFNSGKVDLVLNGHQHVFEMTSNQNTLNVQTARVEGEQYTVIEIKDGSITTQFCEKDSCSEQPRFNINETSSP